MQTVKRKSCQRQYLFNLAQLKLNMLVQTFFFSFGALQDAHAHGGIKTIEMGGKGGEGLAGRDERGEDLWTTCGWDISV